jgi:hypothetical protein
MQAVAVLRGLDSQGRRKVPDDVPFEFVPRRWERYVIAPDGQVVRRYWELCLLWELRNALRAGNIWLENSRQYANPASYLIPPAEWATLREEVCGQVQVSADGATWLHQGGEELAALLTRVDRRLAGQGSIQIQDGQLSVPALQADELP